MIPEQEIQDLKSVLALIIGYDSMKQYDQRNRHIYHALYLAATLKYTCGIRIDEKEPAWPVVFIELPTGQISWHVPQHEYAWDNHTTQEKLDRIARYIYEDS